MRTHSLYKKLWKGLEFRIMLRNLCRAVIDGTQSELEGFRSAFLWNLYPTFKNHRKHVASVNSHCERYSTKDIHNYKRIPCLFFILLKILVLKGIASSWPHRLSASAKMGKYNFTALRVRQTALRQKAADKISKLPQWTQIVADIPPSEVLVRHQPVQHELVRERVKASSPGLTHPQPVFEIDPKPRSRSKKSSHLFLPLKIRYEEDELRRDFFRDHPWELARSRILLESTGRDHERYDWSKLQQRGKRLDGEK